MKLTLAGAAPSGQFVPLSLTTPGHPTTGTWSTGASIIDSNGVTWNCTAGGTPGTWVQWFANPAAPLVPVAGPFTIKTTYYGFAVVDDDDNFIFGVGPTGGAKVSGDRIQTTPAVTGPWLALDGTTNPPSLLMPSADYGAGNRFWFFPTSPAADWFSGTTKVNDIGYCQATGQLVTCTVSGGGTAAGTWVSGFGVNPFGAQVAYDPIGAAFTTACAAEATWYAAGLTSGTAPTITLPDDGQIYKVEWTGPWWTCSTSNLEVAAAIGTSSSALLGQQFMLVNSSAQGFDTVVIPHIEGSGQTLNCYVNCANGTPTITWGAATSSPVALAAYRIG